MTTAFGKRLRRMRKDKGLTMAALADMAGISKSYVWELEMRESHRPSATLLRKLGKALDVTLADLMGDEAPVKASPEELRFIRVYLGMTKTEKKKLHAIVDLIRGASQR